MSNYSCEHGEKEPEHVTGRPGPWWLMSPKFWPCARHCVCQAIYRHEVTQCSQPLPSLYRGENRGTESNLCRVTYPWVEPELGPLSLWLQSHRVTSEHPGLHLPEHLLLRNWAHTVPWHQLRGSEYIYWGPWPLWEFHKIVSPSPRITYTVLHKTLRDLHPFIC